MYRRPLSYKNKETKYQKKKNTNKNKIIHLILCEVYNIIISQFIELYENILSTYLHNQF